MLDDGGGTIWISSEHGIFGCARQMLDGYHRDTSPKLSPYCLTRAEGLPYKVCTGYGQPCAAASRDGRLWFPDGAALAAFDPKEVPPVMHAWPPIIEEFTADGSVVTATNDQSLGIRSGAIQLEFHYTSPSVLSPEQIKYRYRLSGVDQGWVEADARHIAYYTHLAPGHYEFKVQAAAPDNKWQDGVSPLAFEIIPRIYERRSVQIASAVLLLLIAGGTALLIERNRSRRRIELVEIKRAMENERQRIARDIHDELGSGLTEIILLSDNLQFESPTITSGIAMVRTISSRARSLTRNMDEVVWAINPRNDTLESFLTYFHKFAQEYLTLAGIRCRLDLPIEVPETRLSAKNRHHLYLSSKEALNNVVKHAAASEVWLRLVLQDDGFTFSIEDNGKGFSNQPARGNGLANMRHRLEELNGRCEINSQPGKGTCVSFIVITAQVLAGRKK
jgi:signal transduction histidine kinase